MPEEVCLELLDMWQKAGQVSSQDIENLSMAGILGIQKELAAKEMKGDIRKRFAESRKNEKHLKVHNPRHCLLWRFNLRSETDLPLIT